MSKANKDGWVRHRGGKQPVGDDVEFQVRLRDGRILSGGDTDDLDWSHSRDKHHWEIMALRICPTPESILDHPGDPTEAIKEVLEMDAPIPKQDGPLVWRDRILEIDEATKALTEERASLVDKLKAEGFALLGDSDKDEEASSEDMSDPANWREGDLIECINFPAGDGSYTEGKLYEFIEISSWGSARTIDNRGIENGIMPEQFKWHSRPTT